MILAQKDRAAVHVLERDDWASSWALVPKALERIRRFAAVYDSYADTAIMVDGLQRTFASDKPLAKVLVYTVGEEVRGHLLATIENWFGTVFVTIVQYELDQPLDAEMREACFQWLEGWGRSMDAQFTQVLAEGDALPRVYERIGFERTKTILRRPLRRLS